jgi:hypothetical protein
MAESLRPPGLPVPLSCRRDGTEAFTLKVDLGAGLTHAFEVTL